MKTILIVVTVLIVLGAAASVFVLRGALASGRQEPTIPVQGSLWDLKTTSLTGEAVDLQDYAGRVVLVVNLASKCGLTPQYAGLEALYREHEAAGLVVLGFPSNDFMGQEPGTAAEIRAFCSSEYGVTFPLMAKVKVKGRDKCEVYGWLTSGGLAEPGWNFTKYLVGRDGQVISRFDPRVAPEAAELRLAIEEALAD